MRLILNIFFLTFFLFNGFSQHKTYQFTHLSTAEGLSQSSAITIEQDNLGQIWIGTRDGLNKYDGSKFKIYRNDIDNENSISNNDVLSITQDSQGYIWIGTYNGLNKYNPKTDRFTRYFHEQNSSSLSNNTVWAIKELSNGDILIGTSNGLSVYDKKSNRFSSYVQNELYSGLAGNHILCIKETRKGRVFIGTATGLCEVVSLEPAHYRFRYVEESQALYIQDLVESQEGHILIATKAKGVLSYDPVNHSVESYLKTDKLHEDENNVRRLLFDKKNQLWIGTYNGIRIIGSNNEITYLKSNISDPKSLSKNSIKSLFLDRKGSVWIGTYYGGVNIWDDANVNFSNLTQSAGVLGLNYNVVSSMAHFKNRIFLGTEGGGINVYNKTNKLFSYIDQKNSKLLPDNNIKAVSVIEKNELWIGTFNKGIAIYNLELGKLENHKVPVALINVLKDVGVYSIKQDSKRNVWLGTFGKGIVTYNLDTKNISTITTSNDFSQSLSSNLVRVIWCDSKGNIWAGTERGLNKIDQNGLVTSYFYDMNRQFGEDILSVFEDSIGDIWVGTKARGLFKLEGTTFKSIELIENNIEVSAVHSILEDDLDNLWISTNHGIVRFGKNSNKIDFFNQKDGLVGNEFNNNASLKVNRSEFYFGGPSGVTSFNTNQLTKNAYAPQVILTDFAVKNEVIIPQAENDILKEALPFTKSIKLSYDQGNFSVSFSMPNFINSKNNRYKYRLKGLEDSWNYTLSNAVSYTIQNPGNYVFEITGSNGDGVWNESVTSLSIVVKPAPWRSWWAFLIYGLLITTALYMLLSILKSKTKLRHQLELEYIEGERTKEINKTKLEFFTNISHEFRTPLALILGPLQQIIEDYRGSNKIYKKLLVVENSANHLLQLINRLMDFRKLENNLYKLEAAEGNVVKFLQEIYLSFTEFAKDGGYQYNFTVSEEELLVYYDRNKLERVFYNLISNAFRYTPKGGIINLRIFRKENEVVIKVEDTGVGVAKEYQDKIFERFFEVAVNNKPDNDYNKGTGIGLSIAKNIVNLHKGEISVSSNTDDKGSVFTVVLPMGIDHLSEEEIVKNFKFSDDLSQYVEQLEKNDIVLDDAIKEVPEPENQTILLVEDNKPLRKFMKSILKSTYNILEAENGKVGMGLAQKESPDLIISDVVMPVMAGTELCAAIKENIKTSHIPIILLTSRTSLIYKLEGLERGADDYISKPFNVVEFKARIKNLLESNARLKRKFTEQSVLQPNEVTVTSIDERLYKKAVQIVEANISNGQFDVPFFCSELGVSRTMLFTKIKAWSGFTPNEFVQHFRMQRAAQLLEQGKINVSEVSYKVGFKNPKYFSRCFQKKFGKSPTQYADKFGAM
ncbi:response regulator [Tamlana fucoidanivorans]|uniref:histidine kinase n=1 Tax=Allotamlana fucoidanivorans TaxID=2583814 RepID=A0A5C4SP86_9FLAO|nr:two-component regulator propeller domain-containing protein [Tamlana fucoidanivorans]TNJ45837.1 response regulator [Tamlana fucoidanivorans]